MQMEGNVKKVGLHMKDGMFNSFKSSWSAGSPMEVTESLSEVEEWVITDFDYCLRGNPHVP